MFSLTINTNYKSFDHDSDAGLAWEVARILRDIADKLSGSGDSLSRIDGDPIIILNGDEVGTIRATDS